MGSKFPNWQHLQRLACLRLPRLNPAAQCTLQDVVSEFCTAGTNWVKIGEQVDYKLVYREMMRSPQMVKRLIAEASRALALLADKGLVHGRIRPSSIYVNAKGKALANVRIHGF